MKPGSCRFSLVLKAGALFLALGILLSLTPFSFAARIPEIRFERITTEQGLSQETVRCVFQDRRGFLWLGTEDGLNRYDGYGMRYYRHDSEDPSSLSHNSIWTIYEDRRGFLWIGTNGGGLCRYDPSRDRFRRYGADRSTPGGLLDLEVRTVLEDSRGVLWVGTEDQGLARLDRDTGIFSHFRNSRDDPRSISSDQIRCLAEDKQGNLWIATYKGLNRFEPGKETFVRYLNEPDSKSSLSGNMIRCIWPDLDGSLWIGTNRNGVNRFFPDQNRFVRYRHRTGDPSSLSHDRVRSIFQDEQGTIWVGTMEGLNRHDRESDRFAAFFHDPKNPWSLSHSSIWSIFQDRSGILWVGTLEGLSKYDPFRWKFQFIGNRLDDPDSLSPGPVRAVLRDRSGILWVGTDRGGLNRWDESRNLFIHYRHRPDDPFSLSSDRVRCIYEDGEGRLWIGTYDAGLNRLDRRSGRVTRYRRQRGVPGTLGSDRVMALAEDSSGDLWIGTYGRGLDRLDSKTGLFQHFRHRTDDPSSLSEDRIRCLLVDSSANLWVGTVDGLDRFDPAAGGFDRAPSIPGIPVDLGRVPLRCLFEDSSGRLWAGTQGSGLFLFRSGDGSSIHHTENSGLANNTVCGILEDEKGYLWLSTGRGLCRLDPDTMESRNFSPWDGLQGFEFSPGSFCRGASGGFYFGGTEGLNVVHPAQVLFNPHPPQVALTDFRLGGRVVGLEDGSPLTRAIEVTTDIRLSYRDDILSFGFTGLHFARPQANLFSYQLEGLDSDWTPAGTQRYVTYTNLPSGRYTFRVRAANADGVWTPQGSALSIHVTAPLWRKPWFILFSALALIGLIRLSVRRRTHNIRRRNLELEDLVGERTGQLRTLNRDLKAEVAEKERKEAQIRNALEEKTLLLKEIHHRVKNNMQIVSSLLHLQSGQIQDSEASAVFEESQNRIRSMALIHEELYRSENFSRIDFPDYLLRLTDKLTDLYARGRKNIHLELNAKGILLGLDRAIPCGLIVNELVTNAYKHAFPASRAGKIEVIMSQETSGKCLLIVRDDGIGMPESLDLKSASTLGMQLVSALVTQLEGEVSVKTNPGVEFSIEL